MKSDHREGHSSFAQVRIIPYTLCPIIPASSCICITQSDSMLLSGHNFFRWIQSAPPSASHLCTKLGVDWWMSGDCCCSAPDESHTWQLNLATLGHYLSLVCSRVFPNPSAVTWCLCFPSSLPPEPRLNMSSTTSQISDTKSIRHYQKFQR